MWWCKVFVCDVFDRCAFMCRSCVVICCCDLVICDQCVCVVFSFFLRVFKRGFVVFLQMPKEHFEFFEELILPKSMV